MRKAIKYIALAATILLIAVINNLHLENKITMFKPLQGAIENTEKAQFNVKDWFSGDYQVNQEKFINDHFFLRSFFVRLNNQLAFTLFKKAKANGVIIGKKNYLYEENYLRAYYGQDFIGVDSIANRMTRLKFIQDELAKQNKTLLVLFAAGKGSFYPEYFPSSYEAAKGTTNYEISILEAKKKGINFIDFNSYFLSKKNDSKYMLYPRYGIHWSNYAACLAVDSLVHRIEAIRGIDMPDLVWDSITMDYPKKSDYDIANGMNLLFQLHDQKMAYPAIRVITNEKTIKPSALVIADSFYWTMLDLTLHTFSKEHQFWFYNREVHANGMPQSTIADHDFGEVINKTDVIIILVTEANLPNMGWGFIENASDFFNGKSITAEVMIAQIRKEIKNSKEWYKLIKEKAIINKISVDSMLTLDAKWVYEQQQLK